MAAASCLERCWARQNAKLLLLVFYLLWLQKSQALSRLNTELQWFTQNKQIQYKSCKLREIMRWCPDAISVYIRFDCVVLHVRCVDHHNAREALHFLSLLSNNSSVRTIMWLILKAYPIAWRVCAHERRPEGQPNVIVIERAHASSQRQGNSSTWALTLRYALLLPCHNQSFDRHG